MTQEIKLTSDQLRLMSLFQNVTGATARDCIEDEKQNRVIFVVNSGKMGLAIGKGGSYQHTHPHAILKASHPSPYAASGFLGCRHFSEVNRLLEKCGKPPIDWRIT